MTPATKRLLFPLSAPRWQRLAFMPALVWCAAVDAYATTLLEVLSPSGSALIGKDRE